MTPEEYIKEYTKNCSNHTCYEEDDVYYPWLTPEQALKAVELANKELIKKAIDWLIYNTTIRHYASMDKIEFIRQYDDLDFIIRDFRKAMEE